MHWKWRFSYALILQKKLWIERVIGSALCVEHEGCTLEAVLQLMLWSQIMRMAVLSHRIAQCKLHTALFDDLSFFDRPLRAVAVCATFFSLSLQQVGWISDSLFVNHHFGLEG